MGQQQYWEFSQAIDFTNTYTNTNTNTYTNTNTNKKYKYKFTNLYKLHLHQIQSACQGKERLWKIWPPAFLRLDEDHSSAGVLHL